MEIKRSELQQLQFAVIESRIKVEAFPDEGADNVDDLDIELSIFKNTDDDHLIRVLFNITARRCFSDRHGLKINVGAACDFTIDASIDPASSDFGQLVNYSATAITYNNIRAYLQNVTSYYPVDQYILPTIDLNDLCKKYIESIAKQDETQQ